jgi:hypothetical protein
MAASTEASAAAMRSSRVASTSPMAMPVLSSISFILLKFSDSLLSKAASISFWTASRAAWRRSSSTLVTMNWAK